MFFDISFYVLHVVCLFVCLFFVFVLLEMRVMHYYLFGVSVLTAFVVFGIVFIGWHRTAKKRMPQVPPENVHPEQVGQNENDENEYYEI